MAFGKNMGGRGLDYSPLFTYMLSYIDPLERPTHHRKHPNIKVSFRDSGQLAAWIGQDTNY
jgi:hypothetical protein